MYIEDGKEVNSPKNNTVKGYIKSVNSVISFKGKGNMLVADGNVRLEECSISFNGDNALLYLSESGKHPYMLKLDLWRETTAYFGSGAYFNGVFTAVVSEQKNLIVGNGGVFSFGIWVRTADPHLIYDASSHMRTNMSKSVLIGDHVWIGQNAMILKGSKIGSGSVLAAASVLANKKVPSNTVYAGNPAKLVKENAFFVGKSVHNYTKDQTEKSVRYESDEYVYNGSGNPADFDKIDDALTNAGSADKKLEIIMNSIGGNAEKNRFYISKGRKRIIKILRKKFSL